MFSEPNSLINVKPSSYGIVKPTPENMNIPNRIPIKLYDVKKHIGKIFGMIEVRDNISNDFIGYLTLESFGQTNTVIDLYARAVGKYAFLESNFVENFMFGYELLDDNRHLLIFYI